MKNFIRWVLFIPVAAFVTISLFVLMMTLIAEEFKPQDKLENASFEINPKVEDIKVIQREVKVCLLYTSPSPRDGLLSRMPSSA